MIEVNREELAWAAGFFDGEGSTSTNHLRTGHYYPRLSIGQSERAVLDRFKKAVFNLGSVTGPHTVSPSRGYQRKPTYSYRASGSHVQAIIATLWSFLSQVKRDQASKVILLWKSNKRLVGRPRHAVSLTGNTTQGCSAHVTAAFKITTADGDFLR